MARGFEKISLEQFQKDIGGSIELYQSYSLPKRSTKYSAGYDFEAIQDEVIHPGESLKIPTGIKAFMNHDEMLLLLVRSSQGFRYNVRMCNQVGVIDSDYYQNVSNEGHLFVKLQNEGENDYIIKKGDRYCQGIFTKFLTVTEEDEVDQIRISGLGSTTEEE